MPISRRVHKHPNLNVKYFENSAKNTVLFAFEQFFNDFYFGCTELQIYMYQGLS